MSFAFAEDDDTTGTRHFRRKGRGQGGALQQMQATFEAVQSTHGSKKMKTPVNISDNVAANPMAPAHKKPSRCYGKSKVCVFIFWVALLLMISK